jgi:putative ABC transport system permease protein
MVAMDPAAAVSAGAMSFLNGMGGEFVVVLPWGRLGLILGVAAVAAFAASVLPARRAVSRPASKGMGLSLRRAIG